MNKTTDGLQMVRSGIIPYLIHENKIHWLLGSFHDYPNEILMDFGGSCVTKRGANENKSPFGCAIQELEEESKGLLTQNILKMIGSTDPNMFHIYVGKNHRENKKVYFFFVPIIYAEVYQIMLNFNNTPDRDEKLGPMGIYPDTEIFEGRYLTTHNLTDFVNSLKESKV